VGHEGTGGDWSDLPLRPTAAFGDLAYCEVGTPSVVVIGSDGLVAVGGSLGPAQWNGEDVGSAPVRRSGSLRGWYRLGLFDAATACVALVDSHWPITCAAFSPGGDLLAIGAGSYDGGYCFEGELIILDVATGSRVSVLARPREVLDVEWLDSRRIRIVVSQAFEEFEPQQPSTFTVVADDWRTLTERSIDLGGDPVYLEAFVRPPTTDVDTALVRLAYGAGREFGHRRQVWAVETVNFGVVAALDQVELEGWDRLGTLRYRRETVGQERQIISAAPNAVLTNVEPLRLYRSPSQPSLVNVVNVDSGEVVNNVKVAGPCVVTSAAGLTLVRSTDHRNQQWPSLVFEGLNAADASPVDVGGYDLFNHYFSIRRAPSVLALRGSTERSYENKWVVRITKDSSRKGRTVVEPLFALEWDEARDGQLFGGPGVYINDEAGAAIVHAGHVHNGQGLLPGNAFVVRRRYPTGQMLWTFPMDCQATGVDEAEGIVHVALIDGRVVRLDAATGRLLSSRYLEVNGHGCIPLSTACASAGEFYIGTIDGRILLVTS
jgi:hypothetical protein